MVVYEMDEYITPPPFQQPVAYPEFPPNDVRDLCTIDYAGPLSFEVFVDPNPLKTPWEYSASLNKIYIDMKHKFPVNFSAKSTNQQQKLFIRVLPAFEEDRHIQELVHRCICHEQEQDPTNYGIPKHVIQHIIRSDNTNAQYFGDKYLGKRLNIVIPLENPQAGADSVKEYFTFVCKSSCALGMSRKPIQVIFTLEDQHGSILGRRVLRVRICSCPKRDKEKDENKFCKQENQPPLGKRRKLDGKKIATPNNSSASSSDVRLYSFTINVAGEENFKSLAQTCHNLMAAEIVKLEGKNQDDAPFRKCMNDVKELLNTLTSQNGNN